MTFLQVAMVGGFKLTTQLESKENGWGPAAWQALGLWSAKTASRKPHEDSTSGPIIYPNYADKETDKWS